jgi:hypothetical protein
MRRSVPYLSLLGLLFVNLLAGCGGADEPSDASASEPTADVAQNAAPASQAAAPGECPLDFTLTETYDPGDQPLGITFQYPEGWTLQTERASEGGAVTVRLRRPFEVEGRSERIALELNRGAEVVSSELVEMRTAPRSMGDQLINNEQVEFQLGDETLTAGKTVDDDGKVGYAMGVPADEGYYLAGLQIWWDSDDRCKEEVIRLGDEIVRSFELR